MFMSSEGAGTKTDCTGEGLQQFTGTEPEISFMFGLIFSRVLHVVITDYRELKSTPLWWHAIA
jgi:hypothetical protein